MKKIGTRSTFGVLAQIQDSAQKTSHPAMYKVTWKSYENQIKSDEINDNDDDDDDNDDNNDDDSDDDDDDFMTFKMSGSEGISLQTAKTQ